MASRGLAWESLQKRGLINNRSSVSSGTASEKDVPDQSFFQHTEDTCPQWMWRFARITTYNDLDLASLVGEVDGDLVKFFSASLFDGCVL